LYLASTPQKKPPHNFGTQTFPIELSISFSRQI
jgi:hypothetical protein